MKITGHKTESAFMRYIKITPGETATRLEEHWNRLANQQFDNNRNDDLAA